jgi:hypothetical protein
MKGLGGKVASDRVLRACKVTKEKGRAREVEQGRKEIDRSLEFGLVSQERLSASRSAFVKLTGKRGSSQPVPAILVTDGKQVAGCKRIDDIPQLIPGWGCCQCQVYNSYERKVCKCCGHVPCYQSLKGVLDEES